jgi:hypothetical protein
MPTIGLKPSTDVFGEGFVRAAIDGDAVVIVQHNQATQPQVPGQGCGLVADALH